LSDLSALGVVALGAEQLEHTLLQQVQEHTSSVLDNEDLVAEEETRSAQHKHVPRTTDNIDLQAMDNVMSHYLAQMDICNEQLKVASLGSESLENDLETEGIPTTAATTGSSGGGQYLSRFQHQMLQAKVGILQGLVDEEERKEQQRKGQPLPRDQQLLVQPLPSEQLLAEWDRKTNGKRPTHALLQQVRQARRIETQKFGTERVEASIQNHSAPGRRKKRNTAHAAATTTTTTTTQRRGKLGFPHAAASHQPKKRKRGMNQQKASLPRRHRAEMALLHDSDDEEEAESSSSSSSSEGSWDDEEEEEDEEDSNDEEVTTPNPARLTERQQMALLRRLQQEEDDKNAGIHGVSSSSSSSSSSSLKQTNRKKKSNKKKKKNKKNKKNKNNKKNKKKTKKRTKHKKTKKKTKHKKSNNHDDDDASSNSDAFDFSSNKTTALDDGNIINYQNRVIDKYIELKAELKTKRQAERNDANNNDDDSGGGNASPFSSSSSDDDDDRPAFATARHWFNSTPSHPVPPNLLVPLHIYSKLFPFQQESMEWFYNIHQMNVGAILGDEMGLGKTVQIAAFLSSLHRIQQLPLPTLVICPATVLANWLQELHHWSPLLRVFVMHPSGSSLGTGKHKMSKQDMLHEALHGNSGGKGGSVIVMTYSTFRAESPMLLRHDFSYCILDEGHKIRNPDALMTIAVKQVRTTHRLLLTGAPMQNNLRELWSLFDFVYPGLLGTLPLFESQFVEPINVGGYVNANRLQVQMAYRCATVLRGVIEQYILRRLKTAVANQLPDKTEEVLFCRLTDEQRTKYNRFLSSDELDQVLEGKRRSFRAIGILRKICNHPDLLQYHSLHKIDTYGDYSKSGKMKVLHHILPQWKTQGHKALIFSQTQQMLNILETYMRQYQYTYLRMDGNTPVRQRQTLVDRYNNDPRVFLFLLTTRVGGLGVNLVGANRVLLFDPDWNPSVDVSGGGALIIGRMLNDVH